MTQHNITKQFNVVLVHVQEMKIEIEIKVKIEIEMKIEMKLKIKRVGTLYQRLTGSLLPQQCLAVHSDPCEECKKGAVE